MRIVINNYEPNILFPEKLQIHAHNIRECILLCSMPIT